MMIAAAPHSRSLAVSLCVCFRATASRTLNNTSNKVSTTRTPPLRSPHYVCLDFILICRAIVCDTIPYTNTTRKCYVVSRQQCATFFFSFFWNIILLFEQRRVRNSKGKRDNNKKSIWRIGKLWWICRIFFRQLLNCLYIQIILSILLWNGDCRTRNDSLKT